ncbi:nitroreductase [Sulfurivermis fontis]|uniref:nitroreductase n=1 Tax=Sulfurivermis fontis TaxID=1972068 RepID=UPI000FDA34D2|nr:nitroreductase [Sulfurivermis fontis]
MDVTTALTRRSSTRAFLDRPVSDGQVRAILDAARWSPSGVNIQPWQVAVVRGETKRKLADALIAARAAGPATPDYQYYPVQWFEPFKERRKQCGLALYQALDIRREDTEKQREAWNNNYRFFGAPVGLLLFLDRRLGQGAWIDMGMFMQSIMLAAQEQGLATCPQASLGEYPDVVRNLLGIDENLALLGGIALGYADPDAAVNRYRTEREPVDAFTRWYE